MEAVFFEPKVKEYYSDYYHADIYQYSLPIRLKNNNTESISLFEIIPEICIFSGGENWYGNLSKDSVNELKGGENKEIVVEINVIPRENLNKELYETFELYNVVYRDEWINKVKYV